ncbi:MAG: hypothetical protein JNL06_06640 [Alphaproteobacteria bacterium]|nr:hypothetical protein [Alphaproteobacteria bacterium]
MRARVWSKAFIGAAMAAGLAPAAMADGDNAGESPWSFNFTVTSDYRFRGISQSDNDPAIQGSVQYDDPSGFFANVWGSTIDFSPFGDPDASVEIDLTAGYRHAFSEATEGTVKVTYYWYPDSDPPPFADDAEYVEIIAGLTHDFGELSVSGELAYSPDYSGGLGDAFAITGGAAYPIVPTWWVFNKGVEASGHLGHQSIDDAEDYVFWDLGVSAGIDNFTFDVRYVDTDIDACANICDAGLVLTASVGFGGS